MIVKSNREIKSAIEERLTIDISWDPSDQKSEQMVALIASMVEFMIRYNFLDKVVNDVT